MLPGIVSSSMAWSLSQSHGPALHNVHYACVTASDSIGHVEKQIRGGSTGNYIPPCMFELCNDKSLLRTDSDTTRPSFAFSFCGATASWKYRY